MSEDAEELLEDLAAGTPRERLRAAVEKLTEKIPQDRLRELLQRLLLRRREPTFRAKFWAWGVHFFTATGVVWALLALDAVSRGAWRESLAWMSVAVIVDAADGTLARFFEVKRHLPEFDGALLDNVVDFLNFVIVPAAFLHHAELLPGPARLPAAAVVALVSSYQFCQADAKTEDHYFRGFPCYWNVLVLYLVVLGLTPATNLAVVATLCVLVFVPFNYIYPSRTVPLMKITVPLTIAWGVAVVAIVVGLPDPDPRLVWGSLTYVLYYTGASAYLNVQERKRKAAEA